MKTTKQLLAVIALLLAATAAGAAGPYWNVRPSTNTGGAFLDYSVGFKGPEPWADISAYGATTASADNSAAIALAVAAAKKIYIPPGTWNGTLTVTSSMTVVGAGQGRSILRNPNGANGDVVAGSGYNVVIEDLSIDGNVANNPSGDNGISLNTIYNSRIARVHVYNNKLKGIFIGAPCDDITIDNTEASANSQDGYAFASNTIASGQYCKNVKLINSYAHNNTLYGVGIDTPNNTYLRNVNTSIINCRFINNGSYGIEAFGAISPHLINNYIEGSGNQGIDLGSTSSATFKVEGALVQGNTIKNQALGTSCIRMQSIYNSRIIGNRCFDDQGSPTTQLGITWNAGTGNVIAFNDMSGVTTTPIDVGSSVDQIVYGNIGYNTDLSTHSLQLNQGYLQVTNGSTGVTSADGSLFYSPGGTTELWIANQENDSIRIFTNGTQRMKISNTGVTVLGSSTSPDGRLNVWGTGSSTTLSVSTNTTGTPKALEVDNSGNVLIKAIAPTLQKFTSGSGTYTTPTSPKTPAYLRVRMVGGGGGGEASGTSPTAAGAGGNTTFGSSFLVANGGGAGVTGGSAGGTGSVASPAYGTGLAGGTGSYGSNNSTISHGGNGGASAFGGGGGGGVVNSGGSLAGTAGSTNTGGGGGGAGNNATSANAGAGGGAGGYVDAIVPSPSATYSYAVGAAGTAGVAGTGSGASNGGAGGSGYIVVEEYYQ